MILKVLDNHLTWFILGVIVATTINLLTWIPDYYEDNQTVKIELIQYDVKQR